MELIFFFGLNSNPRLAEPPVVSRIGFDPEYLEGDMAQTNCVVQKGDSPLLISWQFNGLPLTNSDHVEIAGMGKRSSILTIDPVMGDHRGNYTCVASNPAGEMAVHAILHVNEPPEVLPLNFPSDRFVEGDFAQGNCMVHKGDLPIIISWLFNGQPVTISDEVQINAMGQRSSILTIDPVKGHHQGNYSCVAANPAGQMAVHMALAVNEPPRLLAITFPAPQFLEGEVAQSNCVLTSGDKPVVISWLFNGRPLHSTDDVQIDKVGGRTSILTIDPVRGHHQGNYTCVASNHAGQMAVDTTMVVNEPPLLLPIHLESDRFLEGDFAQLNCVLRSGDRPVTTTWLFNGRPLVPSDDVHVTKMGQRSSILTIDPVRGHNQGNYTCVATNQAGEAAVHTRLEVQAPPKFQIQYRNQTALHGADAVLECEAEGETPIGIVWKKDGQNVEPDLETRYTIRDEARSSGVHSSLSIKKTDRPDSASFTCIATNPFGSADTNINLIVQEIPEQPSGLKVLDKTGRSVELSWTPPYDGNSPITRYIVEYKQSKQNWEDQSERLMVYTIRDEARSSGVHSSLSIKKTDRPDSASFTCIATNPFGSADTNINLIVQELEASIDGLRETQRKYVHLLRLSRALASHFYHVVSTQHQLADAFADLAQKSPELQEEFVYNAETLRTLSKNGETLLSALNFFVSSVATLCHNTMEDTMATIKLYEQARIEYDAYRTDLEALSSTPRTQVCSVIHTPRTQVCSVIHTPRTQVCSVIHTPRTQVCSVIHTPHTVMSDVGVKLAFLNENKVKVMHKQLLLFHNAISAYFTGNEAQLEATLKQFNVELTRGANATPPSWLEQSLTETLQENFRSIFANVNTSV
ncbi:Down syndrome cell adhesion molecule-like [Hyalella azteca]|uniref:Down syndrome cell adhesion molecule-like n=1 Tax=Hyalella azteca TaxID=294128 RepID=A0A979FHL4_HYAAZ|nr:Down syndrome cell adhesion molecule-like [Hyalella azteca]